MIRRLISLFALVFTSVAAAERCGTDDFGNTVCMDKDGVITTVPADRTDKDVNNRNVTPAGASVEPGSKDARDDKRGRPRCGIDPFGNKVCR